MVIATATLDRATRAEDPVDNILSRVESVEEVRDGHWKVICPAHPDTTPSLDITRGDDGCVLCHCKACGADGEAVANALGIPVAWLFPPRPPQATRSNGRKPFGKIVEQYPYLDENWTLLYEAVRMEPKDFRQRAPNESGGWKWSTKNIRKVLYRLPQLVAADRSDIVFVPEGEKDCNNLAAVGLVAVCNVGGAGKWKREYNEHLAGRHVVIFADNDDAGRKHAQAVAKSLHGIAASVKVVLLPGLPEKGDVSDWLAAGGTKEQLLQIVTDTPEWTPQQAEPKTRRSEEDFREEDGPKELDFFNLKTVEGRTFLAMAKRFVVLCGRDLRYVAPWKKWIVYRDGRWKTDDRCEVQSLFRRVFAEVAGEAYDVGTKDAFDLLDDIGGTKGVNAALTLAQPDLAITPSELDRDPWLLNCVNGTLNLKTGELQPHTQADYITSLCPTAFNPDAASYSWDRFLESTFAGSLPLIEFVQRWCGYCLSGVVTEQRLPVFWGGGANGKSTILNAIQDAVGRDFVTTGARDLLLKKRGDSHPTELADLFGKRLVVCAESDDGRTLAEGQLKQLTGGDRIKARRMKEDFWEFEPTHKTLLVTNHLPRVQGNDHAIWRRLLLVPFNQKFWNPDGGETGPDELRQDKQLGEKLRAEREGILAWMVRGCLDWQRRGLCPPPEVMLATNEYRSREDRLQAFIDDCCLVSPMCRIRAGELYDSYRKWCEQNGESAESGTWFGRNVAEQFQKTKSAGTWYLGIGLRAEMDVGE
jgi:putative DNA primase/helicase